jgi:hypothetical protein
MDEVYREWLRSPQGAAIIADLNARFGGNPFSGENVHATAFRCGQLAVLEYILNHLKEK